MATQNGQPDNSHDVADENYKRTFASNKEDLKSQEEQATKEGTEKKDIKTQEATATAGWATKTKPKHRRSLLARLKSRGKLRHKTAFGFVAIVLISGIWYSSILAPNIILVNVKDLFTNDLADATTALSKYSLKMIGHKLGKAESNCSDPDTIKCRLATMSRAQVLEFKNHGFTVIGSKVKEDNLDDNDASNDKLESRWKVQGIVFPNGQTARSSTDFSRIASSSDKMLHITNNVWNPRSSFFMDTRYKQRIKEQFDLDKLAVNYGDSEKEVDEAFDEAMQGDEEKIDESGQGAFSLKTLASSEGQRGFTQNAMALIPMPHSFTNVQCALYTQGKVVTNSTKRAKEVTLARFAMQYLKAADEIKSPAVSREIPTNILSGKLAWSNDGGYGGKNATDAAMYRHIVMREPVRSPEYGLKYNADVFDGIGAVGVITLQSMFTAMATKAITGAPGMLAPSPADTASDPRAYCLHGQTTSSKSNLKPSQCPALAGAAGTQPVYLPAAPGLALSAATGSRTCPPPPQGMWIMKPSASIASGATMSALAPALNAVVGAWAGVVAQDFTHDTKGVAASDAIFTGTGIILGDMAMSRGMQPATQTTLKEYLAQKSEDDKTYERLARYEAKQNPFDIYNNYSFMGSLVRSVGSTPSTSNTLLNTLGNIVGLVPASLAKTTSDANAIYNLQISPLKPERLQCSDVEYKAIGIDADMGCNVRYSLGKKERDADISKVLDYMLKGDSEVSGKNVKDLQDRLGRTDGEGDAGDVSRQLDEARSADGKPFIDKKTGKPIKHSEYEKFLTYCVNRKDPWGRSGMVVRREGLSEEEKQKRFESKDQNGEQILDEGQGSEYEQRQTASYMSITEGAAADQDWYTGKKCLANNEMLQNFRSYTMACSVDGSFAGSIDCTERDRHEIYTRETYDYQTSNDVQYLAQ